MLLVHYGFGFLVVLAALAAIFVPIARRVVVYLLVVQIVLGGTVMATEHLRPPIAHMILALLVGGFYPMANAIERKRPGSPAPRLIAVAAALILAAVFELGRHALKAGGT